MNGVDRWAPRYVKWQFQYDQVENPQKNVSVRWKRKLPDTLLLGRFFIEGDKARDERAFFIKREWLYWLGYDLFT